jgi:hypothetical protein
MSTVGNSHSAHAVIAQAIASRSPMPTRPVWSFTYSHTIKGTLPWFDLHQKVFIDIDSRKAGNGPGRKKKKQIYNQKSQ